MRSRSDCSHQRPSKPLDNTLPSPRTGVVQRPATSACSNPAGRDGRDIGRRAELAAPTRRRGRRRHDGRLGRRTRYGSAALAMAAWLLLSTVASASSLEYVTQVTGGAADGDALPLVVAVHGLGDRPERFAHLFDDVTTPARVVLPCGPVVYGSGYAWFDPAGKSLGDPSVASGLAAAAARVSELIATLAKTLPTKGRPIVTGFSQGAMVSFAVAALHPDAVAMAIPMSGFIPVAIEFSASPEGKAGRLPSVVALHGAEDPRIPVELAKDSVARLEAAGFDARLETFAGVGHRISPAMRRRMADLIAAAATGGQATDGHPDRHSAATGSSPAPKQRPSPSQNHPPGLSSEAPAVPAR
jgi:phospholipase/carboxylesterase